MKNVLICLFLLVQCPLVAQSDHIKQIASGISRYRTFLFESNTEKRQQLGVVLKILEQFQLSQEDLALLTVDSEYLIEVANKDHPNHSLWLEYVVAEPFLGVLGEGGLRAISDNADMYDLINIGVLEMEYPYIVRADCQLHDELTFYNIQNGETIGEIGAGNGEFGVILGMIYDSLQISLNELDDKMVTYMRNKIETLKPVLRSQSIHVLKGSRSETNFDQGQMDKIILRNTYHHFLKKEKMLRSMYQSLKDDGFLFVYEATKDLNGKKICKGAMLEEDIIEEITSGGFEFVEQIEVESLQFLFFDSQVQIFKFRKVAE